MSYGTEHLEACDYCGQWGQTESDGWLIGSRGVYCDDRCCSAANDIPPE